MVAKVHVSSVCSAPMANRKCTLTIRLKSHGKTSDVSYVIL